jgi:hypothetical protein
VQYLKLDNNNDPEWKKQYREGKIRNNSRNTSSQVKLVGYDMWGVCSSGKGKYTYFE